MERSEIHKILDMVMDIGYSSKHCVTFKYNSTYQIPVRAGEDNTLEEDVEILVYSTKDTIHVAAYRPFVRKLDKDTKAFLMAWKKIIEKERVD